MEEINDTNIIRQQVTVTLPSFEKIRKGTVGETYQYFKNLIKEKSIENLTECLSASTESSVFDASLQFLLVDHLKLENEVVKILLSQNEDQIKRVLECKWFFKNLSAELCTKQIFPYVSFSLRCKIINRLSRHLESTDEAEKYFAFIRHNYENERSDFMLPKCSPEFILSYVANEKHTFDYNNGLRVLLNICKRYPTVGLDILSTIFDAKRENHLQKYNKILRYLSGYHSDLIVPFLKKHSSLISCHLFGRKLTKKLAPKLRQNLFPDFMKELPFKEVTLFSILSFEEQAKYIATIVRTSSEDLSSRNWARSDHRVASLLKLVLRDKRQAMIDLAFKEVYNVNFNEYPKCWSPEVLESLPIETRRPYVERLEKFAEEGTTVFRRNVGYNCFSPENPEEFLHMYESRRVFERFKEILRKTPAPNKRETILVQLVKSCGINKDVDTLQNVVEFVATRHRNDDNSVIFRFMEAICEHFPISTLNSTIFEKVDDLAYFCNLKGRRNDSITNEWKERHIHYRLENGLNVDTHTKNFFESALIKSYRYTFLLHLKRPHSRLFAVALCKEAVSWIQSKTTGETDGTSLFLLTGILQTCQAYNKLNKAKRIFLSEIPGLEEILKKEIEKKFPEVGSEVWSLDVWERYYSDIMNDYNKPKFLFHVFKRRPDSVETHLKGILKILFSFTYYMKIQKAFFMFLAKVISFSGKAQELKDIILNEFKNGESVDTRKTALLLYSQICTIEEFNEAIESYIPKQEKLGQGGTEDGFDEIQIAVPGMIKNVNPRWKNLQVVTRFFLGDFMKIVLSSLYSCCYNTRCDVVIPFLKEQLEQASPKISHVKDIIRLLLELSDRNGRTELCLQCWSKHKHYSVRSAVLRFVSKSFLEQRSQESYAVFEKCILDCDEATSEALPELSKIPEEFFNDYVKTLWGFSECQKPNFKVNFRKGILQEVSENNINLLSSEFCEEIIKSHLFVESSDIALDDFTAAYLAAKPEAVEKRVLMLLDLVNDRKPDAQSLCTFLNILISKSLKKPSDFDDMFTIILKNWPQYPLGVLYQERVLFTYHNIHQKVLRRSPDGDAAPVEFGKELKKLYTGVDNLKDLLSIYVEGLKTFFGSFQTYNTILTLKELVTGSQDRTIAVLAILCMPSEAVVWYKKKGVIGQENIVNGKKELNEFVKILESYGDDVVNIYLRSKFEFVK